MKNSTSIIIGIIIIVVVVFFALRSRTSNEETMEATVSPDVSSETGTGTGFTEVAPSTVPDEALMASPSVSPEANTVSVSIDDNGFAPATTTVASGTTIVFTNNGQALHWPASDPHPTHTGLPGFDAKKGLATGESYSFTFTKIGTFGMHDHLNPTHKGTIIVK